MDTKYYLAFNANRHIAGQVFTVTKIIGSSAVGVLSTENPKLIAELDALVKDPTSAVSSISLKEFEAQLESKKKIKSWPTLSESSKRPPPVGPIKGQVAAVVIEGRPEPKEDPDAPITIDKDVTSVEEAVSTAKVEIPTDQPPADPPAGPTEKPKSRKSKG